MHGKHGCNCRTCRWSQIGRRRMKQAGVGVAGNWEFVPIARARGWMFCEEHKAGRSYKGCSTIAAWLRMSDMGTLSGRAAEQDFGLCFREYR